MKIQQAYWEVKDYWMKIFKNWNSTIISLYYDCHASCSGPRWAGLGAAAHLVVHEDVHHVVVHLLGDPALGSPGEQHKLDAKQWHQNQGGSHCFHVQVGLCLVGVFQLGDENTDDVQQEEKVHLSGKEMTLRRRSGEIIVHTGLWGWRQTTQTHTAWLALWLYKR